MLKSCSTYKYHKKKETINLIVYICLDVKWILSRDIYMSHKV